MTPIEIIALIMALFVLIKLIVVTINPRRWFNKHTSKFWGGNILMILAFIVAAISLFFLLQELTIIQIWATMFFSLALIIMGLAPFSKYMVEVERKWFLETNSVKKGWFAAIIWAVISVWVLYALFT